MRRFHLLPILLATVLGCASASSVPRPSSASFVSPSNVITGEEIRAHSWATDALSAIRGLRPAFLRPARGLNELPAVFVDGMRYRDLAALRTIGRDQIQEIRYLTAIEALVPYGGSTGAIVITTGRYAGRAE